MYILPTLDYELYLGSSTGSVDNCLIRPTTMLCRCVADANAKFTFFVDATYLLRLKDYTSVSTQASADYNKIVNQLESLSRQGHDLELHIHPHWAYSNYDDGHWTLDDHHYCLHDMTADEAVSLVGNCKALLEQIKQDEVRVYRAGGFSTQPTSLLADVFRACNLVADSSVCPGMVYHSSHQQYDYSNCPAKSMYRFSDNICVENQQGHFIEIPISMFNVSPLFHWRFALRKVFKSSRHTTIGDGVSIPATKQSIRRRLLHYTPCIITNDGMKVDNLFAAYKSMRAAGSDLMCIIGHPKLATRYSIDMFGLFSKQVAENGDSFVTAAELIAKESAKAKKQ